MTAKKLFIVSIILLSFFEVFSQSKKFKIHTIAFYNVENLYDTINDPGINDDEFLPSGKQKWTSDKYNKKLNNIANVISEIGNDENPNSPTIIGLAEVENRNVLEDLVKQSALIDKEYGIVHFDSPDKRGIDVAFLYQRNYFKPTSYKKIPLSIQYKGFRIFTRDQLLVTGLLDGEEIHFIINHWPSRSGGEKRSSPNREAAAALNKKIIDSLYKINAEAKIIIMGDMNDGPYNKSIKQILGAKSQKGQVQSGELYNPMAELFNKGIGSVAYRDAWDLFDQIILSESFIRNEYTSLRFWKAGVFNPPYLSQKTGQYKGYPLRNWNGEVGYSDHFPVYIFLIKQI